MTSKIKSTIPSITNKRNNNVDHKNIKRKNPCRLRLLQDDARLVVGPRFSPASSSMERTMMKREITMVISIHLALSKRHHLTDHTTHSLITDNDLIAHRRLTRGQKTRQLSPRASTPSRYIFKRTK
jgi:hypothetical protein